MVILSFIFLLCFILQITFLLIFSTTLFYRKKELLPYTKKVSIIICSHNEAENLKALLPALKQQNYSDFEVILVNDRSSDGTTALIRENFQGFVKEIYIDHTPEGWNSKKYALEKGIEASSGELLLLTDADCIPYSNEWISNMSNGMDTHDVSLGYSPYKDYPGLLNLIIRFETLFTAIQYFSFAVFSRPYMAIGRNVSYTKKWYLENGGMQRFKAITGGDDDLLINHAKPGFNVLLNLQKSTHTVSEPKRTWKEWFNQKKRHLNAGKYYRKETRIHLGLLMVSTWLFYLIFIILMITNSLSPVIITLFLLRTWFLLVIFALTNMKLENRLPWYLIPFLEICWVLMYPIIGVSVLVSKNIKWI